MVPLLRSAFFIEYPSKIFLPFLQFWICVIGVASSPLVQFDQLSILFDLGQVFLILRVEHFNDGLFAAVALHSGIAIQQIGLV